MFAFDDADLRDEIPNAFDEMASAASSVSISGNTFTAKDTESGATMRINYIFENADAPHVIKNSDVLKLAFSMDNNTGANFSILFYDTKETDGETVYDSDYIGWMNPDGGAEREVGLGNYAGKKLRGFEFCTNDGCKELKVTKMKVVAAETSAESSYNLEVTKLVIDDKELTVPEESKSKTDIKLSAEVKLVFNNPWGSPQLNESEIPSKWKKTSVTFKIAGLEEGKTALSYALNVWADGSPDGENGWDSKALNISKDGTYTIEYEFSSEQTCAKDKIYLGLEKK